MLKFRSAFKNNGTIIIQVLSFSHDLDSFASFFCSKRESEVQQDGCGAHALSLLMIDQV